jgi:hypothetical protein
VKEVLIKDGTVQFVYNDQIAQALKSMGTISIRRASHVEPTEDGRWTADLSPVSGTPLVLGPFSTRQEALDAEVKWLSEHLEAL